MARKTFTTYTPEETHEIDINGTVFNLNPSVPGDVLLDFLSQADTEKPAAMAGVLRSLLDHAVVADQLDQFHEFIRDPKNNVNLEVLAEIAGFAAEKLAGAPNPSK